MASDRIIFRETKEFKETLIKARSLLQTNNKSDLIRILSNLGLERLEEAFKGVKSVILPLKMSETEALASSLKIYLLKEKKRQLKEL